MDNSFKCECGNEVFKWFRGSVRCITCSHEYMSDVDGGLLVRRFNQDTKDYIHYWDRYNEK